MTETPETPEAFVLTDVTIDESLAHVPFDANATEGERLLWCASLLAGVAVSAGRAVGLSPLFAASAMTAAANAVMHFGRVDLDRAAEYMPPLVASLLNDGRVQDAVARSSEAIDTDAEQKAADHAAEQLSAIMERAKSGGRTQ